MLPTRPLLRLATLALAGLIAACSSRPGDRIHQACVARVDEGLKQAAGQLAGAEDNGQDMMATMRAAAHGTCETLRTTCNDDPENALCQAALAELEG